MKELNVTKVFSRGIAIGPIFLVQEETVSISQAKVEDEAGQTAEIARVESAIAKVAENLTTLAQENPIFAGHLAIATDFSLHDSICAHIRTDCMNAEAATQQSISELKSMFEAMDDSYMQERAADIVDVGDQLVAALQNRGDNKFAGMNQPSIIVARDLFPSDTARLDLKQVLGFITEEGGVTSHVSIMAKSLGIPALVGASGILEAAATASNIAFDAQSGRIVLDPDPATVQELQQIQKQVEAENARALAGAKEAVRTRDGHEVKVYANVGNLEDIRKAKELFVDGVGLFRSEFLYMENDHFPTEEEQFAVYKEAVEILGHEIIIRTLDIGGDKQLCYYQFEHEENPFLGFRAIRLCLNKPEILRTQLRAILRASAFGPIRVMIPMLISLGEARKARKIFEDAKEELRQEGIAFDEKLPFGMMVETPASVFLADDFAKEMDFFSIGTNDLTQYTLAVDRGNQAIKDLYNSFNPAVLRAIAQVIDAGHRAGIEVGMCGEFASNPLAARLLLGLGLDEFSMSSADTPRLKELLRSCHYEEAQKRARAIIALSTCREVEEALEAWSHE